MTLLDLIIYTLLYTVHVYIWISLFLIASQETVKKKSHSKFQFIWSYIVILFSEMTVELLILNFDSVPGCCCFCWPQESMRLWRRLGKSVMLKIWSTAVTHTAASLQRPHRIYWLLCVCVWGGAIWGPPTLTLLPFVRVASLDFFFFTSLFCQSQSLSPAFAHRFLSLSLSFQSLSLY